MTTTGRRCSLFTVVVDVVLYILVSTITLLLSYNKLGIEPVRRGLFCDDETIQYPYQSDTVSDGMAALICAAVPLLAMLIVEGIHMFVSKEREASGNKKKCLKFGAVLYRTLGTFLSGAIGAILLSEVLKLFAGRLRPHFLDVCDPDYTKLSCADGFIIVPDDVCNVTNKNRLLEARKSFPSGHASMAAYGATYLVIYLQVRFIWRCIALILPLIQFAIVTIAAYISISRVNDNKHHFGDVIGGAIVGLAVSAFVIKYFSNLPKTVRQIRVNSLCIPEVEDIKQNPKTVVELTTL